jgi:hypothetical protein
MNEQISIEEVLVSIDSVVYLNKPTIYFEAN